MRDHRTTMYTIIFSRLLCVLFVFIVYSLPAHADSENKIYKIELPLDDISLKPGTAIKLKTLAIKSAVDIDINSARLIAVEVLAKSRQGKGKIQLKVGNSQSKWVQAGGTEKAFNSKDASSFSTIKFLSPDNGKQKAWQLLINGYIKIRTITLYMTRTPTSAGGSI